MRKLFPAAIWLVVFLVTFARAAAPLSAADKPAATRRAAETRPFSIEGEIDDRAILAHVLAQAERLIDDPKSGVVEAKELAGQLKTARQRIELPPPTQELARDWEQLYARARKGVVIVAGIFKCNKCKNWHAGPASGFVLRADGVIVTNYHVLNQPEQRTIVVMTSDGKVLPVKQVLAAAEADDIAVLQVDARDLPPLPLQANIAPGAPIAIISHPSDRFYMLTLGHVARLALEQNGKRQAARIQVTADFAKGSSGGPVFNAQGQVVGFVCSTNSIYYNEDARRGPTNFQMVIHSCVPAKSLLKLIGPGE